jgi:hypothetical protein
MSDEHVQEGLNQPTIQRLQWIDYEQTNECQTNSVHASIPFLQYLP